MKNEEKKEALEPVRPYPELFSPLGLMRRFTKDMESLFEDFQGFRFPGFFNSGLTEFENVAWVPQIEVLHNDGQLMVRADLPGLTKDDVKVEMTNDMLTISGERKKEIEEKREGFYRSERSYGSFYRQIPLPEGVKTEKANAIFRNGVLEITMPAAKLETPVRKLEIKEAPLAKSAKAAA